jgi:hypothetical protein
MRPARAERPRTGMIPILIGAAVGGALLIGLLASAMPVLALGVVGGVGLVVLLAQGQRLQHLFVGLLGVILVGYMWFGKGFAYVGVPPLFVGELVLGIGLIALLLVLPRLRLTPLHLLLLAFMALGLVRTLPYLGEHGMDALRDAVVWLYGLFALVLSVAVRRRDIETIVRWYGRLLPWFVYWTPIVAFLALTVPDRLPTYPGTDVQIPYFKGGDVGVHMAGVAGFMLLGLYTEQYLGRKPRPTEFLLWPIWIIGVVMAGAVNRGGLISAGSAIALITILRPSRKLFSFIAAGSLAVLLLMAFNFEVDFGGQRTVSVNQIADNIRSVFVDTGDDRLEGTKGWRLRWWGEIIDYTFHGPYFWSGKGFGINLAIDDGFDPAGDGALRAPHNGHMTVLARMGVPGLVLWVALQLGLAVVMLVKAIQWRRANDDLWAKVMAWLLVYWAALTLNMSFDVYLEGPQGGIWFWSIIGLALAVLRLKQAEDQAEREPPAVTALSAGRRA